MQGVGVRPHSLTGGTSGVGHRMSDLGAEWPVLWCEKYAVHDLSRVSHSRSPIMTHGPEPSGFPGNLLISRQAFMAVCDGGV